MCRYPGPPDMAYCDHASSASTQIIVNADDFGRSSEINRAVLLAHHEGILTSASLMVAGAAADEAIDIARRTPSLAVGLHVVIVDGPASLSQEQSPHLPIEAGRFPDTPGRLGMRYFISESARKELEREIGSQFSRFAATGLPLSHVDAHQHMHVHPMVFPLLVRLAREYQATGMRLPRDDLGLALHYDPRDAARKIVWAVALGAMSRICARQLPAEVQTPRRCHGLFQSGHMQEEYVIQTLHSLHGRSAELYFHPTTGPRTDVFGPNPEDLATLLSPRVMAAVRDCGLQLISYKDLNS